MKSLLDEDAEDAEGDEGDEGDEAAAGEGDGDSGHGGGETEASTPALTLAPALDSDGGVSEAVLGQLWELVTDDFSEGARHDAFIAACEAQNKLAFAAARYREWLADHPEDEVATRRQKQLLALAQVRALAVSSRESQQKDPLRKALTAFLVMVVLLVLVILAAPILLRSARSCRATGPDPAALRKPTLPMVNNLRHRSTMGSYRGLTPRRHRQMNRQLRNLRPPPPRMNRTRTPVPSRRRPDGPRSVPGRPAPMRSAPMRSAPMRPAPTRPAPVRSAPMPG